MKTYHCDLAIQHWASKLGKSFQTIALLSCMWNCAGDPWAEQPKVFLAASRLKWLIPERTTRAHAIGKLVKIGAIKKSIATRSGCSFTLMKPDPSKLATRLRDELANISPRDYRFNKATKVEPLDPEQTRAKATARAIRKSATPSVSRKKITANNKVLGIKWPFLAKAIEYINDLPKGSARYARGAKDVEALGAWLIVKRIRRAEFSPLVTLVKKCEGRPEGDALRYVFEADTEEKAKYLANVLAALRSPQPPA